MSDRLLLEPFVLHFATPRGLANVEAPLRHALEAQGFSGSSGEVAVITHPYFGVFCGLEDRAIRRGIRRAVGTLPISRGSRVRVATEYALGCDPKTVADIAFAELMVEGYSVEGENSTWRVGIWAALEALAVQRAREWTNAPGDVLMPERFAQTAIDICSDPSMSVDVYDRNALQEQGFGAILAVGQGSIYEPRLVDLRYEHPAAKLSVVLVGKGVTFDSGGLSLKSPTAMAPMRMDKVGAAVVLAVMSVLPGLGYPVNVRGLLPLAENMVGPAAVRPGDVVVGRSGLPITIVDTDFEGRVLMSDALSFASEEAPDIIVDIAALTYQVVIALGADIGGLFANNDDLARMIQGAGDSAGEEFWRLPLAETYRDQVLVDGGVKNHPESDVGRAITAALFLERFVPDGVAWAHLDITGPAWRGPASGTGATGFGVRTLLGLVQEISSGTFR